MESGSRPGPGSRPGLLMAIGGAEDKRHQRVILRRFVEAAGGPDATIVVLATASEVPETGERYSELFYGLEVREVEVLSVRTREDALDLEAEAVELLERASGFFMTGGSQLRITSALGGTRITAEIRRRHAQGMVVAGTSAGAAVLSRHMISMGESGSTPRRRLVQMAQGLGLAPDLVIDQHFRRRDRLGRLLTALSYNPEPLGLGVDEDTVAILDADGVLTVLGTGAVTVVDASHMRFTDSHSVHRGQPVAMLGLRVDFLTSGCRYDVKRRTGIALPTPEGDGAADEEVQAEPVSLEICDE
jgi:cyanophycinase